MFVNPLTKTFVRNILNKKEHVFVITERMDVEMINNMTANGTSAINLQTNVRTYRPGRNKMAGILKVLLIFLLITFSVYFTKTSISVPEERFVYQL